MLKFFRQIRRKLLNEGNLKRYPFYAIGEILLVMIGILLALQVNNLNEDKKQRKQETILLSEMRKNLKLDLSSFEKQLTEIGVREKKVSHLLKLLKSNAIIYQDSLNIYFGAVYGVEISKLNKSIYKDLISRGFDLVKKNDLRFQINQFFDRAISTISEYQLAEEAVNQEIKPYYIRHFKEISFNKTATPINPDQVINDIQYHNLVNYRLINLQSNQLMNHPLLIDEMKKLIYEIEEYLSKEK